MEIFTGEFQIFPPFKIHVFIEVKKKFVTKQQLL